MCVFKGILAYLFSGPKSTTGLHRTCDFLKKSQKMKIYDFLWSKMTFCDIISTKNSKSGEVQGSPDRILTNTKNKVYTLLP